METASATSRMWSRMGGRVRLSGATRGWKTRQSAPADSSRRARDMAGAMSGDQPVRNLTKTGMETADRTASTAGQGRVVIAQQGRARALLDDADTEQPMLMSTPKNPSSSTRLAATASSAGSAPAIWQTSRSSSSSLQRNTADTRRFSVGTALAEHISVKASPQPP